MFLIKINQCKYLRKAGPAACSWVNRSLCAQADRTVHFRGAASSASSKKRLLRAATLWPPDDFMNKDWKWIYSKPFVNLQHESHQHIHIAANWASKPAKNISSMLYVGKRVYDKDNLWQCIFHCPPVTTRPDSPGASTPKSCWNLLAAKTSLYYNTLAPVLPVLLPFWFFPLLQHHVPPPIKLRDYLNYSSCCAAPHWTQSKLTKHASLAPLFSALKAGDPKWTVLKLMSYSREFGRGWQGGRKKK